MKKLSTKKLYVSGIAASVLGLSLAIFAGGAIPATAQSGSNTVTAQQAIHDLKASYGVMIIPREGVDLNAKVNPAAANQAGSPRDAVVRLADSMNARARTLFIVLPASADRAVTTLADAQAFDNSSASVTLQLSGVPASSAIRAVAASDDATLDLRSDVGDRPVNLNGTNMSVAQAIAQIAAQTNTHWIQAYEIAPRPEATMAKAYHRTYPLVTMNVNQGPTGPVIFHPYIPPAPPEQTAQNDQTAPTTSEQAANDIANSSPPVNQSQATPTVPANPYDNGYYPYYMMQNGYAYTPDGYPYQQSYGGWVNGGAVPGADSVYLLPVYGFGWGSGYPGFGGGMPFISGGTSTTSGF